MRVRARLVAAGVAVALIGAGVAVWAASGEEPISRSDQRIDVAGTTLDTTFYATPGKSRRPAVLLAHGFGGSKTSMRADAVQLASDGYAVLTWSARGFGMSGGQIGLNSPDHEVKDVSRLIDWLARRPEVRLDRPGDPRLGMAGPSYGGAISLLAAGHDPRIDAIVPMVTYHDLADVMFPNATGGGPGEGVFKKMWAGLLFTTGSAGLSPELFGLGSPRSPQMAACGRFLPEICAMYQKVAQTGRPTPEAIALLRRLSPAEVTGRIKVPTLLVQGLHDSLFPLDHADANARAIAAAGAPVEVAWIDGGHDGGDGELDRVRDLARGWFDRWLGGAKSGNGETFTVTRSSPVPASTRRRILNVASSGRYPGLAGTTRESVELLGPEQSVINPAGGSPASISSLPGLARAIGQQGGGIAFDVPGQSVTFQSDPVRKEVQITGSSSVRLRVAGGEDVTLFAKLYDIGPGGQAVLPQRLAAPLRVTGAAQGKDIDVRLPAIDHLVEPGHRLRLVLTTTDMGYATPSNPATYKIALAGPKVTLPTVAALTGPASGPPWWTWVMPLAALIIAGGILLIGRGSRRTGIEGDPDLPLEIFGLTKSYENGQLAVDDVSFVVEHGQVLGLLGPNGAGKTTTLRMLMGLIHPDAGHIRIFGENVVPGAPVLARLGSFVEGPGFLPHLSGRDNLVLYWRATGRPAAEAHLDEALKIADLGGAVNRPVRTYSHGMKQRLAIAQAMLGLPDLLVLDEPTNGLDPPQIREMREVLTGYAREGRTVILSSHLLAEVEQTCTHVVVMNEGRTVAAGPVADIIGSDARLEDAFLTIIGEAR